MEHTAWLIEDSRAKPPLWLRIVYNCRYDIKVDWTEYASLGMRFCRKEDAEMFWLLCPQPGVIPAITEHKWIDGSQSDASEKQP